MLLHTLRRWTKPFSSRTRRPPRGAAPKKRPPPLAVEALEDRCVPATLTDAALDDLLLPCFVTNTNDSGPGSLREAIHCANRAALPSQAAIVFRIPTSDPNFVDVDSHLPGGDPEPDAFVIAPVSELPPLDNEHGWGIVLDGHSQTRFGGDTNPFGPEIVLVNLGGITEPPVANGIRLFSDDNRVFGLNIQSFAEAGIRIGGSRNWVAGNYIGTDATGRAPRGNGTGVVIGGGFPVSATDNRIGTNGDGINDEAERNVISANAFHGVSLFGDGTAHNVVAGNYIGTDATGRSGLGNLHGVAIQSGARFNRIGTDGNGVADAAERNVIAASLSHGLFIHGAGAHGNVVAGNFIGTDATSAAPLDNLTGVLIFGGARANRIGTDGDGRGDAAERNVISANRSSGVRIFDEGTDDNVVAGNYIGVDVTGSIRLGNGEHGVAITGGARFNRIGFIGSPFPGVEGNIISANGLNGVHIEGAGTDGNVVARNRIGTDRTGSLPLGNGGDGVRIIQFAAGNFIGTGGGGNLISANGNEGVRIQNGATGNWVVSNFIGTDVSGTRPLGNASDGVAIVEAPGNTIGVAGAANLISGNALSGVALQGSAATGNMVLGNLIGTDVTGRRPLGNGGYGVHINVASNNVIGSAADGARNVISANRAGVFIGSDVLPGESIGNRVLGNFIGVDVTGRASLGNGLSGVDIFNRARQNLIDSNVVSGNGERGVVILGPDATGNVVSRNYVGVDVTGNAAVGNRDTGVLITGSAHHNLVHNNVLSGNGNAGLDLFAGASDNLVTRNYVGLNVAGTAAIPNTYGVTVQYLADRNTIGTNADGVDDASEGNVISGNHVVGVLIHGGSHNVVAGNTIGLAAAGGANPVPNNGPGVWIIPSAFGGVEVVAEGNRIGYNSRAVERNIISANRGDGVRISATHPELGLLIGARDNIVAGNVITNNAGHGVHVLDGAVANRIGTDGFDPKADAVEGNRIAGNLGDGVRVVGIDTVKNSIRGNSIHSNGLLGIDLGGDGVTPNDGDDSDTGPNELQNHPRLGAALSESAGTRVRGTLKTRPGVARYVLDFYASREADPSGSGEGQRWLGSVEVLTDEDGVASFEALLDELTAPGEFVTATATDAAGNTSEFSPARPIVGRGGRG